MCIIKQFVSRLVIHTTMHLHNTKHVVLLKSSLKLVVKFSVVLKRTFFTFIFKERFYYGQFVSCMGNSPLCICSLMKPGPESVTVCVWLQVNMVIGILVFNKLVSRDGILDKKLKHRAG